MGVFDRLRRRPRPGVRREANDDDMDHLTQWTAARHGVEAFVEPATTVTAMTVVLVAHDGEWTRRRVDGVDGVRRITKRLQIPAYDVAKVGYPQRMRDFQARAKAGEKAERARRDDQS